MDGNEVYSLTERAPRSDPASPDHEADEDGDVSQVATESGLAQESAIVPIQDVTPEGRSSPRPWEPARVRKLKMAYGVTGAQVPASPRRSPEDPRVWRAGPGADESGLNGKLLVLLATREDGSSASCAHRPATAHGGLRGPWMPTGSTKPEPLQSFGTLGSGFFGDEFDDVMNLLISFLIIC
eukprot:Skav217411  [mRNA]  locus=scaffold2674:339083:344123:- [translate_table: standard]